MAGRKNKRRRRRVSKKEYLLSSKKCWLIETKLLPVYSHLVDTYSDQLKDTWTVKVEESQFESVQIKEEPTDEIDYETPIILPTNEVCIIFLLFPRALSILVFKFCISLYSLSKLFLPLINSRHEE